MTGSHKIALPIGIPFPFTGC